MIILKNVARFFRKKTSQTTRRKIKVYHNCMFHTLDNKKILFTFKSQYICQCGWNYQILEIIKPTKTGQK